MISNATVENTEHRGQSADDEDEILRGRVWTLKKNGRVVSGTDVHRRALACRAAMLHEQGRGGGIIALLLPKTEKERIRLDRDRRQYQLALVSARNTGERGKARDLELIAAFLAAALAQRHNSLNPAWKVQDVLGWIVQELKDRESPIYRLAFKQHRIVLEKEPSLRWWQRRVAELRKMSR
jgi:hypothetical protein